LYALHELTSILSREHVQFIRYSQDDGFNDDISIVKHGIANTSAATKSDVCCHFNSLRTSQHLAITFNNQFIIHYGPEYKIRRAFTAHHRVVTDLHWSHFRYDQLTTCSLDGFIHIWDVRSSNRPINSFGGSSAGATQVQWNRKNEHVLASAHNNAIHIWDTRHGSVPLLTITTDPSQVSGLDWCRTNENLLLAYGGGMFISIWDANASKCQRTLTLPVTPIKARFTPLGNSILYTTSADYLNFVVQDLDSDRQTFAHVEHSGKIRDFDWMVTGDNGFPKLVTWGYDSVLRRWDFDAGTFDYYSNNLNYTTSPELDTTDAAAAELKFSVLATFPISHITNVDTEKTRFEQELDICCDLFPGFLYWFEVPLHLYPV
jgi:WD40 repeat protein